MSHDLICSWLGLEPGEWPPDHYRLLGLQPGEANPALIEQRVHERLDAVRRYQMMHPEQATEAMNRLAQAFVCLTEPASKRAYDRQLLGERAAAGSAATAVLPAAPPATPPPRTRPARETASAPPAGRPRLPSVTTPTPPPLPALPSLPAPKPAADTMVMSAIPTTLAPSPPVEAAPPPAATAAPPTSEPPAPPAPTPAVVPLPQPAPPAEPFDPLIEAAQSPLARRGLRGKAALYERVLQTRRLLAEWSALEPFLASPKKRLHRATEGQALIRRLAEVRRLLKGFPPLLGEAGQPGYLVLTLAHLGKVPSFQSFSPHQREALSRDWRAGLKLLLAHRSFLRKQLHAMRKHKLQKRLSRVAHALLFERPGVLLALLGFLAVQIALWRTYAADWLSHLLSH